MPNVDPRAVANYGRYLGAEATVTLPHIMGFAIGEGLDTDGFDTSGHCLLKPIGDAIAEHGLPVVHDVNNLLQKKMYEAGDGFINAAKHWHYAESSNEEMFGGLEYSPAGQTTLDEYSEHVGRFKLTELDLTAPARDESSIAGQLDGVLDGFILKALNWVWKHVDGKTFEESIIEPLLGNFYSISANGDAWQQVGESFTDMAATIGNNATTLFTYGWYDSDDSHAAEVFLRRFWTKGAAAAGKRVGDFLAQGFHDLAQIIPGLVQDCINGVLFIIEALAEKLAAYADPFWGAMEDVGRFIAKLFGVDTNTIIDEIEDVISVAKGILEGYRAIRDIAEGITDYVKAVDYFRTAVQDIPDIKSTIVQVIDAPSHTKMAQLTLTLTQELKDETDAVSQMSDSLDDGKANLKKGLDELDEARKDFDGHGVSIDDVKGAIDDAKKAKDAMDNDDGSEYGDGIVGAGVL